MEKLIKRLNGMMLVETDQLKTTPEEILEQEKVAAYNKALCHVINLLTREYSTVLEKRCIDPEVLSGHKHCFTCTKNSCSQYR